MVWAEERMCIAGELTAASTGRTFANVNPATEQVIGVVADGSADDMDRAIAAARHAFDHTDWSTDVERRVRCLTQLQAGLLNHLEELRETLIAEAGAPRLLTMGPQLEMPIDGIGWVAELAAGYEWIDDLGRATPFGMPTQRYLHKEAAGVVGAITPWNFPVQINLAKIAPALAAGCTAVLKPAPDTPYLATLLGRIALEETDLPAGVLNVVTSSDHQVGAQLSGDPRVDVVSFTGSTATGKKVMVAAADSLTRVFLELGGKSASVVLDDADLEAGVTSTCFQVVTHAGQGCAITTRLLVPRRRFDEAVGIAAATLGSMAYGDPSDPAHLMGPLISQRQRERVLRYIEIAIDEGATVVTGGGIPADRDVGFYVEPTLLVDVDEDATVSQEEIFGPVLVMLPFDDEDDAVRIANHSAYGLSGAVFGSHERAEAVARRIRTGTVAVNGGLYYGPDVPFGGYKHSGLGREMGRAGFEEYLELKAIAFGA